MVILRRWRPRTAAPCRHLGGWPTPGPNASKMNVHAMQVGGVGRPEKPHDRAELSPIGVDGPLPATSSTSWGSLVRAQYRLPRKRAESPASRALSALFRRCESSALER